MLGSVCGCACCGYCYAYVMSHYLHGFVIMANVRDATAKTAPL